MASEIEIKCINKSDRTNDHERIRNVGGVNSDGRRWKLTEPEAITGIETGKYKFWTQGGGKRVDVVIAKSPAGNKYLKTTIDGVKPNNLLSLPECQ